MDFDLFLSPPEAARVRRVLDGLVHGGLQGFALTGSLAMRAHLTALGIRQDARRLNDIDVVSDTPFDAMPVGLTESFVFRHIHPEATEGKMLLQLVNLENTLRVDLFRGYPGQVSRSETLMFANGPLQVVSLEDLAARCCSLLLDLASGQPVASKHARDFLQLSDVIDTGKIEAAWRDHRKPGKNFGFKEASDQCLELIEARRDLLVVPEYSTDVMTICAKCQETESFRLGSPTKILAALGYC